MLAGHDLPLAGVALLEGEALGVGAVGEDDGRGVRAGGAEDVRAEDEAVVHGDWEVPVDLHGVADFSALGVVAGLRHDASLH